MYSVIWTKSNVFVNKGSVNEPCPGKSPGHQCALDKAYAICWSLRSWMFLNAYLLAQKNLKRTWQMRRLPGKPLMDELGGQINLGARLMGASARLSLRHVYEFRQLRESKSHVFVKVKGNPWKLTNTDEQPRKYTKNHPMISFIRIYKQKHVFEGCQTH